MKHTLLILTLLSANLIAAQNYKFLGSYTSNGTPEYLTDNDEISYETLDLIDSSLLEGYPVPEYNPHYISSGYDTDLILEKDADVWVTFVKEGAGYKNVLGFYTYDIKDNSPTKPKAQDITIIFPNVSAKGSGGGLETGNKVKIGSFKAGTGIGWVLLANGWNDKVTSGFWQLYSNPDFNPEADANLRNHNVLLSDPESERIILGFEDIRRDFGSCDNDYNDAVFYITANPFDALKTSNYADINSATDVSSANNGGLESNGDLASLIAKRNFTRIKKNSFSDKKQKQLKFNRAEAATKRGHFDIDLVSYFPESGLFGTETSYVSSADDLIGVTNAEQIFSVDYYEGEERVSAALATATSGGIYDHSKVICDRLNSSSLEDVRALTLLGHEIIMIKIERANGLVEYALNFSVQQSGSKNILHSYWNIAQYPEGDYLNFQVWGGSMSQVSSIAVHILGKFNDESELTSTNMSGRVPTVFVKKGFYKNGQLHLKIKNKTLDSYVYFEGNNRPTELSEEEYVSKNIDLSRAFEEDVQVDIGNLFDVGFSVTGNNSPQSDALYLADGPWGIDYLETETKISNFDIEGNLNEYTGEAYYVERNATVSGETFGTMNLFRNILPGDLAFNVSGYETVSFNIQNTLAVELVLVTEGLTDWNNRLRFQLPANPDSEYTKIPLESFKNPNGTGVEDFSEIRGLVFSVQGNYTDFQPFLLKVSRLAFGEIETQSDLVEDKLSPAKLYNYPNPFKNSTALVLPRSAKSASVTVIDMLGRTVHNKTYAVDTQKNEIPINLDNLPKGIYRCLLTTDMNENLQVGLMIE